MAKKTKPELKKSDAKKILEAPKEKGEALTVRSAVRGGMERFDGG